MKVRVFQRIYSALIALLLIAVAVFLLGVAWNIIKYDIVEKYVDAFYNVDVNSWILTGIACVVFVMAVGLFFISFGVDKKSGRYLNIGTEETGAIRISDITFKEMVNKNAKSVEGVIDSQAAIKTEDKNVNVVVKVKLEEDVVIPQVCAEIQNQIKTNIEAMSGVTMKKIDVLVDNKPKE